MTIDTQRLRRIGHAVGLECGHNAGKMIKAAADQIDAQAAGIERLREALRGLLQLDEENHQRYPGDEDVCQEVRIARAALSQGEPNASNPTAHG